MISNFCHRTIIISAMITISLSAMSDELKETIIRRYINSENTVTQPIRDLMVAGELIAPSVQHVSVDEALEKTQAHWLHKNWDYENARISPQEKLIGMTLLNQLSSVTPQESRKPVDLIIAIQGVLPSSIKCLKMVSVLAQQKVAPKVVFIRGSNPLHDEQTKNLSFNDYHKALEIIDEKITSPEFNESNKPRNQEELVDFLTKNTTFSRILDTMSAEYSSVQDLKNWAENQPKDSIQKVLLVTPDGQRDILALNFAQPLQNSPITIVDAVQTEQYPELRTFYKNQTEHYEYAYLRDFALTRVLFRINQMKAAAAQQQ